MHRCRAHEIRSPGGSPDGPAVVAAVLPAYRTASSSIRSVIERIPASVRHVIVVDGTSPDGVSAVVSSIRDPRVHLVSHGRNRGVGGVMKTGEPVDLGAEVGVKLDMDGQMNPALIPAFVAPVVRGRADRAKGNRFADLSVVSAMPPFGGSGTSPCPSS